MMRTLVLLLLSLQLTVAPLSTLAQDVPGAERVVDPNTLQEFAGAEFDSHELHQGNGLTEGEVEELARKLEGMLPALDEGIRDVDYLTEQLDAVPESDREAVLYRRDERSFQLLRELDKLAREAAQLPADEPLRQELTRRMQEDYASVTNTIFERMASLNDRIARYTEETRGMGGADKLALEAYVFALQGMRIDSYNAAADLIDSRQALGLPVERINAAVRKALTLHAETLAGRLKFFGTAIEELRDRLTGDPQNADLAASVNHFSVIHSADIGRLEKVVQVMERLGIDVAVYKALMLDQGHTFSVRELEGDLLKSILDDRLEMLRDAVMDRGPDWILNLLVFLGVLLAFRLLSRLVKRLVSAACERSGEQMSTLLKDVLVAVSGGTVMLIGIFIALSYVGISLGPMLAGLGVAGFIVGFALQDTLGNFAAGGMILIYRPYDVDDFIEVAGASGLVKKMSLVSTTITTFDNQTLVVPNSKIWGDVIKNVTAQKVRRVDMVFGISYSDDIAHAENVLRDILDNYEAILSKPEPLIKVHELGDSSVNFAVRPWVKTADYWDTYWDITREVKMRFDQEGISIPFPQRDVHHYQEEST